MGDGDLQVGDGDLPPRQARHPLSFAAKVHSQTFRVRVAKHQRVEITRGTLHVSTAQKSSRLIRVDFLRGIVSIMAVQKLITKNKCLNFTQNTYLFMHNVVFCNKRAQISCRVA